MKEAYGLIGLAAVLLAVLVFAPFLRRFTEGFADATAIATPTKVDETQNIKDKVLGLTKELDSFKELLKNPSLDKDTQDKIAKEITDRQTQIATLTGQPTPSELKQGFVDLDEEEQEEGFQGILSADLEKNSKATEFLQTATQGTL